jgi:hypothetical protein
LIKGIFNGNKEQVEKYREKLKKCLVDSASLHHHGSVESSLPSGLPLLPELFVVPHDAVTAEKKNPGSQKRVPNENIPLVWAESLFILGGTYTTFFILVLLTFRIVI